MLTLSGVTVAFGDRVILDRASWHVGDTDRVGLVGPNGEGKSTLLRAASGKLAPLAGEVIKPKSQTVGYLPQEVLAEALQDYTGTMIFVSHDRHFLRRVATKVIEIKAGLVTEFPWAYADYEWWKNNESS